VEFYSRVGGNVPSVEELRARMATSLRMVHAA
jgi:hypothetical protein